VREGAASVEEQRLTRDVGLNDAGCAVDHAEAIVADLAGAAQNVVGIGQSEVAAVVIETGIDMSKCYDASTREGGIAADQDTRRDRGRESAIVDERVLDKSGTVTAGRNRGARGNGDVANRPIVEGDGAGRAGVIKRASHEFGKKDGHIRSALRTNGCVVIEDARRGSVERSEERRVGKEW